MPFAGYKNFADCIRKNKDKSDPEAYCGFIKHKVEDPKKETSELMKKVTNNPVPTTSIDISAEQVAAAHSTHDGIVGSGVAESKDQVTELPVNTMASDPTPMSVIHQEPIDNTKPSANVGSIGAPTGAMGPLGVEPQPSNPHKNLDVPVIKEEFSGGDIKVVGQDKSKQKVESIPSSGTAEVKVETKKEEPKQPDPKPVEPAPHTNPTEVIKSDPKDVIRIKELEEAIFKLQNNAKIADQTKAKAVQEARDKAKKDILDKVKSVVPDPSIMRNWGRGELRLAKEVKKILYEESEQ